MDFQYLRHRILVATFQLPHHADAAAVDNISNFAAVVHNVMMLYSI